MKSTQAIIYIRVSTDKQVDNGASLETQEKSCLDWCFRHGIRPLQTFRDEGKSAKSLNRPEMQRMFQFIAENHKDIDYLLVYQMDRLSRRTLDYYEIIKALGGKSIEIRDTASTPEAGESDDLVRGINILVGEHDNKLKARRVKENMARKGTLGHRLHKAPYGLKNVRDVGGVSTVEPIPDLASKISEVLRSFSTGLYTKRSLADKCNKLGLTQPNGKPMSIQMVDKMLKQPLYAGLEKSTFTNNEYVDSVFEGLIPKVTYFSNQDIMSGKKDSARGKYKLIHPNFPLRGFVFCQECGSRLTASASTGRAGKKYPRYNCKSGLCSRGYVKPELLHEQFENLLSDFVLTPKRTMLIKTIVLRKWNEHSKALIQQKGAVSERIMDYELRDFKAREKYVADKLAEVDYNDLKTRYNTEIENLRNQLGNLEKQLRLKKKDIEYAIEYMGNVKRLWQDASPEMKVVYQQMIFPEGIFYDLQKNKFGIVKYSPLYTLASIKKDPSRSLESLMVNHIKSNWNQLVEDILNIKTNLSGLKVSANIPIGSGT